MARPVYQLGFDGIIALAGAYVLAGDELIYDQPMKKEDLEDLIRILHEDGVFCTIETKDKTYGDENLSDFLDQADGDNSEIERWRQALKSDLGIQPMSEYDGSSAYKIVIMCTKPEQLLRTKAKYEKDYDFVIQEVKEHGNCLNGELIHRSFDKGKAIRIVAEHYGVPIKDTISFGDSMNDLTAIEAAGVSCCMGNGAKALKEKSDHVLPDLKDDGLAYGFELLDLI